VCTTQDEIRGLEGLATERAEAGMMRAIHDSTTMHAGAVHLHVSHSYGIPCVKSRTNIDENEGVRSFRAICTRRRH
jgi:hypothetical protein